MEELQDEIKRLRDEVRSLRSELDEVKGEIAQNTNLLKIILNTIRGQR